MNEENYFVPKILLHGDKEEFFARIGQRPFKLVGELKFVGEADGQKFHFIRDGKFSLDGKFQNYQELPKILTGGADYLVFTDSLERKAIKNVLQRIGCPRSQLVSLNEFKNTPVDAFYDVNADNLLMNFLKVTSVKTLLDVDAHFSKSQLLTKGANDVTEIDCISETELLPIKENIYSHVYKKISDCQFKHYDAALVYGRANIDFIATFSELETMTDVVITFARFNSDFEKYISANAGYFEQIHFVPSFSGRWFIFRRHKPKKNFAIYVVTHKTLPPEHVEKLPVGYKIIHAGRAISQDLGYLGDNTGDNISHLNPYLNELTALYWMWKNTSHTIIGLSHYRRFFTESTNINFSYDKILTEESAEKFLQHYDVLLLNEGSNGILIEAITNNVKNHDIIKIFTSSIKKFINLNQPDYIDAFDYVFNYSRFFNKTMFVTRDLIFNNYCKWLFSFIIDACNEFLKNVSPNSLSSSMKRISAYFGEHLMTVWLIKNRLRIKELNIMQVPDL